MNGFPPANSHYFTKVIGHVIWDFSSVSSLYRTHTFLRDLVLANVPDIINVEMPGFDRVFPHTYRCLLSTDAHTFLSFCL